MIHVLDFAHIEESTASLQVFFQKHKLIKGPLSLEHQCTSQAPYQLMPHQSY